MRIFGRRKREKKQEQRRREPTLQEITQFIGQLRDCGYQALGGRIVDKEAYERAMRAAVNKAREIIEQ